jgi:hypothetical protein
MKYYLRQQGITQPKNNAQKHLQEFIEKLDRTLVNSDGELNHILKLIEAEVTRTNAGYPRCRDIQIGNNSHPGDDSISIWLHTGTESSFASLTAMKVEKEYHEGMIEVCMFQTAGKNGKMV